MRNGIHPAVWLVVALVCGGAGFLLGAALPPGDEAPPSTSTSTSIDAGDAGGDGRVDEPETPRSRERPARRERALSSDAQDEHGLNIRPDEIEVVREALRVERARRSAQQVDGSVTGMEMVRRAFELGAELSEALWEADDAAARVSVQDTNKQVFESTGAVTQVSLDSAPPGTTVFEFGPGRFEVQLGALVRGMRRQATEGLELRGAGIDRTQLDLLGEEVLVAEDVRNLVVRDLTFIQEKRRAEFLDVRGRVAVLLERVRFTNWPSGGYSAPIGLDGMTGQGYLVARECDFAGSPGGGRLAFAPRGKALALFERCTFRDMQAVTFATQDETVVHFRDCTFRRTRLSHGQGDGAIRLRGARVEMVGAGKDREADEKRFGLEHAVEATDVTFVAVDPPSTVAHLRAALGAVVPTGEEQVLAVRFSGLAVDGSSIFRVAVRAATRTRAVEVWVDPQLNASRREGDTAYPRHSQAVEGALPLDRLLQIAGVSSETPLREVSYTRANINGENRFIVPLRAGPRGMMMLDALTGQDLSAAR